MKRYETNFYERRKNMDDALKKAQDFVAKLKNDGTPIQSAYLFGSYAKGTARKDSDIDVCVVSPTFGKNYIDEIVELNQKADKIDIRIEAIPMTPEDFSNRYDSLCHEIKTTGIPIFS